MNWQHTYGELSVAAEIHDESIGLVPMEGLIKGIILHKNSVAENKAFWNRIPIHADTCECDVADS